MTKSYLIWVKIANNVICDLKQYLKKCATYWYLEYVFAVCNDSSNVSNICKTD